MNILVTGGSGFIGSHLVERLVKESHEITIVDRNVVRKDVTPQKIHVYSLNATSPDCERLFSESEFDVVVHLAFSKLPSHHSDQFYQIFAENFDSLNNILKLSALNDVKKFIILSSYEAYGLQNESPVNEQASLNPIDQTGSFWQLVESVSNSYHSDDMRVNILRVSTIYGPRHPVDPDNDIVAMIERLHSTRAEGALFEINRTRDYIYIQDVVDAIVRVIEGSADRFLNISSGRGTTTEEIYSLIQKVNHSSEAKPSDFIKNEAFSQDRPNAQTNNLIDVVLDNSRAAFSLEWSPKFSLESGISKTLVWAFKNQVSQSMNQAEEEKKRDDKKLVQRPRWMRYRIDNSPDFDTVILFIVLGTANWLMFKLLGINLDLMLLYVAVINLYFGLKQGGVAIALAIFARFAFTLYALNIGIYELFSDVTQIMYLTLYILLGVFIGYTIDSLNYKNSNCLQELEATQAELASIKQLYEKSLEIKRSLQSQIELNDDALGKVLYLVNLFDNVSYDDIFDVTASFVSDILKVKSVQLYQINQEGTWLRLTSSVGNNRFGQSILIKQNPFLDAVINKQHIYVNHELLPDAPIVSTPIIAADRTIAVLFLDQVDFSHLDQYFISVVKILTLLIANSLNRRLEYEQDIAILKYHRKTMIMQKVWFDRLMKSLHNSNNQLHHHYILLKVSEKIATSDYLDFYNRVSGLIRETDSMGELVTGHLGILINHFEGGDIIAMMLRFSELGYHLELLERGDNRS